MTNIIEQGMLMGLGAAAMTGERVQELVDEFVKRGQISRQAGEEMMDSFRKRAMAEGGELRSRLGGSMQDLLRGWGLVTRREWEDQELKVAQLEHRLSLLEKPASKAKAAARAKAPARPRRSAKATGGAKRA